MDPILIFKNFSGIKKIIIIVFAVIILLLITFVVFFYSRSKSTEIGGRVFPTSSIVIEPSITPTAIKPPPLLSLAPSSYVQDELIVKYKMGKALEDITDDAENKKIQDVFDNAGVATQRKMYPDNGSVLKNYYIFQLKKGTNIINSINLIKELDEIDYVQPNYIQKAF